MARTKKTKKRVDKAKGGGENERRPTRSSGSESERESQSDGLIVSEERIVDESEVAPLVEEIIEEEEEEEIEEILFSVRMSEEEETDIALTMIGTRELTRRERVTYDRNSAEHATTVSVVQAANGLKKLRLSSVLNNQNAAWIFRAARLRMEDAGPSAAQREDEVTALHMFELINPPDPRYKTVETERDLFSRAKTAG
jgi:hypothetical protein